jgi:hypothetical protein
MESHPNLDSVPYREFVVEPPPGFIPTPSITSYVPIEHSYNRLTKGDTNNFFEWTARHEAPMVMDSGESRPWRKGDPPIPKDVVMWIDCKGDLHNQVIFSLRSQVTTQATQLTKVQADFAAYKALTEQRMDKIGQLLKTVLPSS